MELNRAQSDLIMPSPNPFNPQKRDEKQEQGEK